jgi:hypothetical protein
VEILFYLRPIHSKNAYSYCGESFKMAIVFDGLKAVNIAKIRDTYFGMA